MAYDPEHVLSYQSIERHTIPILHRLNGEMCLGSGVLVEIQDKWFVATAFHCLEQAVLLTDGIGIPKDGTFPAPHIPILNRGGDKDIDIAFLEIKKDCLVKTVFKHFPCTLDQFYIGNKIPTDCIIHMCGWPQYGEKLLADGIERSLEGLLVRFMDADRTFLRFQFSGKSGKWDSRNEWVVKETPSPHGFSGGGCWAIIKVRDDELYAPTKTTKLLAIQSEWNGINACKAPLISEWVRVIYSRYPQLRDAMLSEISKS